MGNISYHCPNCGSGLSFNIEEGMFVCEYCDSVFDRYAIENQTEYGEADSNNNGSGDTDEMAEYICNSCGAKIIASATTAATKCYYCHNTVIMNRRLGGSDMPSRIIPFKLDKETAKIKFREWIFKKTYIPEEFRSDQYLETIQGVYFPYWMVDVDGEISYFGNMYVESSEMKGKDRVSYRNKFKIEKEGNIHMEDIMFSALKNSRKSLVEGVQPFDESGMEAFTMTYLSGFQAEQKDVEIADLNNQNTANLIGRYAEHKVAESLEKRAFHDKKKFSFKIKNMKWEYSLMPIWVLTYKYKEEFYYFAVNGQTGKTCGRIPIDKSKLFRHMSMMGAFSFVFLYLLMFFLGGAI